ncbi:hypothetical protein V5799_027144 [Amblyomma americanum]|uniref:Uncharacterized protein n=1 Tax=Amblyomma americanum TaxID=6943 RepID=A0AAQ4DGJ9_AMBAM
MPDALPREETKLIVRPPEDLNIAMTQTVTVASAIMMAANVSRKDGAADTFCPNLQQNIMVKLYGTTGGGVRRTVAAQFRYASREKLPPHAHPPVVHSYSARSCSYVWCCLYITDGLLRSVELSMSNFFQPGSPWSGIFCIHYNASNSSGVLFLRFKVLQR